MRDRRLADVHVAVRGIPSPASDRIDGGAPPIKPGPATRRVHPDEACEDDPEITALLAMPHSEQQALLRAGRYPAWFTRRKHEVTAATLKARLKRKAKAPVRARLQGGCRLWAIVSFAIETAMRRGEMVKLRWKHVHLQKGDLELPASITQNRKPRIVPLTVRALRSLATQPRCGECVFDTNANTVKLAFKRARARVGCVDLRVHDLRHGGTSRLFEKTDLRANEIGHVTGHTDPRMLERYDNKRPGEFVERVRRASAPGRTAPADIGRRFDRLRAAGVCSRWGLRRRTRRRCIDPRAALGGRHEAAARQAPGARSPARLHARVGGRPDGRAAGRAGLGEGAAGASPHLVPDGARARHLASTAQGLRRGQAGRAARSRPGAALEVDPSA